MRVRWPSALIFPLHRRARLVLLALPLLAAAQQQRPLPDAADPAAATAPLQHQGLQAAAVAALPVGAAIGATADASRAWRAAHEAVGAFPRGHADILLWEARSAAGLRQTPEPDPAAGAGDQPLPGPAAMPPQQHGHGSRP